MQLTFTLAAVENGVSNKIWVIEFTGHGGVLARFSMLVNDLSRVIKAVRWSCGKVSVRKRVFGR